MPRAGIAAGAVLLLTVLSTAVAHADALRTPGWERSFRGLCMSPIAVRNGMVYVATDDGVLHVLKAADGGTRWTYPTGRIGPAVPVVEQGRVWLATGDGSTYALDAFTGRRLWVRRPSAPEGTPGGYFLPAGPASLGKVLIQRVGRRLVGMRKTTGETASSLELPTGELTYPAVTLRSVVIGARESLYAVGPELETVKWRANLEDEGLVTPATGDDLVYTGTRRGAVIAVEGRRGQVRWRYSGLPAPVTGVSTDGVLVFASTNAGNLYAFAADTGRLAWRFDTEGSFVSQPAASGGSTFFGSNDGRLYSVNADDGSFEWAYETDGEYVTSVATEGNRAYFVANTFAGEEARTRLVAFDVDWAIAGIRAFTGSPIRGRRAQQDTVSTVLVDSGVVAAKRVGPRGGIVGPLMWPYRFLLAMGNPNGVVGRRGAFLVDEATTARVADSLSMSGAVLGLTAGPGSLALLFGFFVISAIGFVLKPGSMPIIGAAGTGLTGSVQQREAGLGGATRGVLSNPRMLGIGYAIEAISLPIFVLQRLVAGPADDPWTFGIWMSLAGVVFLVVSSTARIMLVNCAAGIRRGDLVDLRSCAPRAEILVRTWLVYVVMACGAWIAFSLVCVAGVLNAAWLIVPSALVGALLLLAQIVDCHLILHGTSVPKSLVAAITVVRKPRPFAVYLAVGAAAMLAPAMVGAASSATWALVFALIVAPFASSVMALLGVDICS